MSPFLIPVRLGLDFSQRFERPRAKLPESYEAVQKASIGRNGNRKSQCRRSAYTAQLRPAVARIVDRDRASAVRPLGQFAATCRRLALSSKRNLIGDD